MQGMARVLVVDDEENIRLVVQTFLKKEGYEVAVAESAEVALSLLERFDPDFILADVRMRGMTGIELCGELQARGSHATAIVMSAFGSVDLAIEAMKAGAYDYIAKPFKQDEVLLALRKAEERESLKRENRALRRSLHKAQGSHGMLGKSETMQKMFVVIDKVASHATTVLIQGESGTGKELVAHAIHAASPRSTKNIVAINCGAIPESLLESELFGHMKGAFTDAYSDKKGLFEEANGGTLFLDEVGELPLALQVKLLRVLQEGKVRPIGGTKDKAVDVRVVAATVRDLEQEVKEGRFREDLYYRLNVLQIKVPPLRERGEDIAILIEHFVEANNGRLGTRIRGIESKARKRLLNYAWPGNVRELQNVIERAVVLTEGETIGLVDMPERILDAQRDWNGATSDAELSIKKTSRQMEEILIARALERTKGNRTAAAKLLEISHRALLYKMKDYGIQ